MWDVVWTDPNRELLREHRARKLKKRGADERSRALSGTSSVSTASPRSSAESAFARFRSRGPRQINTSKASSKAKSSASLAAASSPAGGDSSMPSPSSRTSASTKSQRSSSLSVIETFGGLRSVRNSPRTADTSHQASLELSPRGSISSARHAGAVQSQAALVTSTGARKLAPSSTGRRGSSPPGVPQLEQSLMTRPPGLDPHSPPAKAAFIIPALRLGEPVTPPLSPTKDSLPPCLELTGPPAPLAPPPKSPLRQRKGQRQAPTLASNPKPWRPARHHWPSETRDTMATAPQEPAGDADDAASASVWNYSKERKSINFECLVAGAETMAQATPAAALSRLRELWAAESTLPDDGHVDAEALSWMFSTMQHLDLAAVHEAASQLPLGMAPRKVHNILALYESKASALYLAASNPTRRLCHLSDAPLPHQLLPNVQPLSVAAMSATTFPIPPQLFEAVYSLSLPSLCEASELPGIVRNMSSCLKPGGTLHMTLIDPLPSAGTMGGKLGRWLDEHLLKNLEEQSRCARPCLLMPRWLGEASLRGPGSTLTTVKFFATPANVRLEHGDPDPAIDRICTERETRAELRSLIGRMLWREVWGAHVTGGSWWWEDDECMEECLALGTFWEYHLIEAVKDPDQ